jgi:hypothetical protein
MPVRVRIGSHSSKMPVACFNGEQQEVQNHGKTQQAEMLILQVNN